MKKTQRGHFAPFFLFLTLVLLTGCGEQNLRIALRSFQNKSSQVFPIESACTVKNQKYYQNQLEKIDELFAENFKQQNKSSQSTMVIDKPTLTSYSVYQPLVFSHKSIDEAIVKLQHELKISSENSSVPFNDSSEKLLELRAHALRLQFNDCRQKELKTRQDLDPRAFLFLQDLCDTEECYQQLFLKPKNRVMLRKNLMEMCQQINTKDQCALSLEVNSFKKSLDKFLIETKGSYLIQKYSKFYTLRQESLSRKLICKKDFLKTKILINIFFQGTPGAQSTEVLEWIKNKWNNELIEFDFTIVAAKPSPQTNKAFLTINWIDGPVSFVDWSNPFVIHLSNSISTSQLRLVAPHEFGHYIGFPDCYVEFMNNQNEYVYFELPSKNNLMCSLSAEAIIPEYYREQIEQNLCQF